MQGMTSARMIFLLGVAPLDGADRLRRDPDCAP